jgi:hypothetical protein
MRAKAAKQPATTAVAREQAKRKDGTVGYTFVAFSIGTYGRLGPEADKLLKELAKEAASTGIWVRDVFLQWMRSGISLSLTRGNANII